MCGAHKRHHSTVRSILLLHTHSYLYLNASLFVPYYCCITPRPCACCLIIFETPCAISIFVTNLNTYTVPILFFYIKKRLMVIWISTSLGNVVEFGVPFVCWFCDDDLTFKGAPYRYNTVSHIFNSCTLVSISCVVNYPSVLFVFFLRLLVVFYYWFSP